MKYKANPVEVDAFRIVAIGKANPDCSVDVKLDNGDTEVATSAMMSRMVPAVGDFWVVQSDGYIYLNPKSVFERKYSPVAAALTEGPISVRFLKPNISPDGDIELVEIEKFGQRVGLTIEQAKSLASQINQRIG